MTNLLKAAVSGVAVAAFVVGCVAWGKSSPAPAMVFPYAAAACWLTLALTVSWVWHKELRVALLTTIGAGVAAMVWSVTLVDFPPWAIERTPVAVLWLIVLSPALLAAVAGATMRAGYLLSGGMTLLLGGVAVFPVSIWNVQTHMSEVCKDVTYVYPYVTPAYGFVALATMALLGAGGAAMGRLLRRRFLPKAGAAI